MTDRDEIKRHAQSNIATTISEATGAVRFGNELNAEAFALNVRRYIGCTAIRHDAFTVIVPALAEPDEARIEGDI